MNRIFVLRSLASLSYLLGALIQCWFLILIGYGLMTQTGPHVLWRASANSCTYLGPWGVQTVSGRACEPLAILTARQRRTN